MLKKHSSVFLTFLGLFLALGSILTVASLDHPLADRQLVTFVASTGDPLVGMETSLINTIVLVCAIAVLFWVKQRQSAPTKNRD